MTSRHLTPSPPPWNDLGFWLAAPAPNQNVQFRPTFPNQLTRGASGQTDPIDFHWRRVNRRHPVKLISRLAKFFHSSTGERGDIYCHPHQPLGLFRPVSGFMMNQKSNATLPVFSLTFVRLQYVRFPVSISSIFFKASATNAVCPSGESINNGRSCV